MKEFSDDRLYLDDLHIGQRFTSGTHVDDEAFEPIWLCDERDKALLFKQGLCAAHARAGLTARVLYWTIEDRSTKAPPASSRRSAS